MEKGSTSRLKEIQESIKNGKMPEKRKETSPKKEIKGFFIYLSLSLLIILTIGFGIEYYGGMSFFDENVTHRSCDFLSIEGFPTLVRCSDGTYWDANKHIDGQSSNIEEVVPVAMAIEVTPPPFSYQKVDTSKL